METIEHYLAMEAFCRQRSKMEGENESFWLAEAEILQKLIINAIRLRTLQLKKGPSLRGREVINPPPEPRSSSERPSSMGSR